MSEKYDEYLRQHINGVREALGWMLGNLELPQFDEECKKGAHFLVLHHDETKRCLDEYVAYDSYFYGDKDDDEFMLDFDTYFVPYVSLGITLF